MGCKHSQYRQYHRKYTIHMNHPIQYPHKKMPAHKRIFLTDVQLDVIRSTWPLIASDKSSLASNFLQNTHTLEPRMQNVLNNSNDLSDARQCSIFSSYIACFISHIDNVCNNLESIIDLPSVYDSTHVKDLMLFGAFHATLEDFEFVFFNTFLRCLHITWETKLREEYTKEVHHAWNRLFEFIVTRLEEGYLLYFEAVEPQEDEVPEMGSSQSLVSSES